MADAGMVRVPEDAWGPGSALIMFGASVGGGVTGVSLVMEAAPGEVSLLSAGICVCSETSGQEALERGAGDPPA